MGFEEPGGICLRSWGFDARIRVQVAHLDDCKHCSCYRDDYQTTNTVGISFSDGDAAGTCPFFYELHGFYGFGPCSLAENYVAETLPTVKSQ